MVFEDDQQLFAKLAADSETEQERLRRIWLEHNKRQAKRRLAMGTVMDEETAGRLLAGDDSSPSGRVYDASRAEWIAPLGVGEDHPPSGRVFDRVWDIDAETTATSLKDWQAAIYSEIEHGSRRRAELTRLLNLLDECPKASLILDIASELGLLK